MTLDRAPYLVKIAVPPRVDRIRSPRAGGSAVRPSSTPTASRPSSPPRCCSPTARGELVAEADVYGAGRPRRRSRSTSPALPPGEHVVRLTMTSCRGQRVDAPVSRSRSARRARAHGDAAPVHSPTPHRAPRRRPRPGRRRGQERRGRGGERDGELPAPAATRYTRITGTATLPLGVLLDTDRRQGRASPSQVDGADAVGDVQRRKVQRHPDPHRHDGAGARRAARLRPRASTRASVARAKAKKKKKRSLWGKDSGGIFRTRGNGSVATVRGTEWRTEDTCAGTTIYVRKGAVSVWPRSGGRSTLVRAGQRLFTPRAAMIRAGQARGRARRAVAARRPRSTPALERAERATIDARFAIRGTQPVSGVAVVGIDERSFERARRAVAVPPHAARAACSTGCARPACARSSTTSSSRSRPRTRTTTSRSMRRWRRAGR